MNYDLPGSNSMLATSGDSLNVVEHGVPTDIGICFYFFSYELLIYSL